MLRSFIRTFYSQTDYVFGNLIVRRQKYHKNIIDLLSEMPKVVDNSALRGHRNKKHVLVKGKGTAAANMYLQVIGDGSEGSPRSLNVFSDQWSYLFNCGEGTQRLAHEYKTKLSKLEHIFFTHASWANIGGLPGLILTIQSIGVPKITLHGPNGIGRIFDMTRGFLLTDDIQIEEKLLEEKEHSDHILKVKYVQLYGGERERRLPTSDEDSGSETADYYDHIKKKRSRSESKSMMKSDDKMNPLKKCKLIDEPINDRDVAVAYICKPTIKPGTLNMEKCFLKSVPVGPLLGQLKEGKDVTLPNGELVRSIDVVSPPDPSPVFIVLECPSEEFLDDLLEAPSFRDHQKDGEDVNDHAAVVVHFSPSVVVKTAKYQEWLERFPSSTEHMFLNDSNRSLSSIAVHKIQHQLNLVHSDIFPLLKETQLNSPLKLETGINNTIRDCKSMFRYHLRRFTKSDYSHIPKLDPQSCISECTHPDEFEEFNKELSQLKILLPSLEVKSEGTPISNFPEVVFLGTGSSIPSKVRNTSGILIKLSNDQSMIFDCGEGTCIQLFRLYGPNEIDDILLSIKAIFISHLHADHHIGLIEILQKRRKAALRRGKEYTALHLLAPKQIMWWLKRYDSVFEPILNDFKLIPNEVLLQHSMYLSKHANMLHDLNLEKVETVYAVHCRHAFSVAVTQKGGWKVAYSGDTMPCQFFVDIGKDCNLLIHEATMEDELKSEAVLKRHSTTSEAIEQGTKMNAKFTMLTHFSQRYAKIPRYTDKLTHNVGIAFDNMKVNTNDLSILPHLVPALKALFAEDYEDMEEKTARKLRNQAREQLKMTKSE